MIVLTHEPVTHTIACYDAMSLGKPTNVTKEAIEAVREYMLADINKGENAVRYHWKRNDGKYVELICAIVEDS